MTVEPSRHEQRKRSFNDIADLYAAARPAPPPELFNDLVAMCSPSGQPLDVLEVGCGPGTCSVHLVKRVGSLTCVELGEKLASVARRRLADAPHASVEVSPFEDWDSQGRNYNVVFASASWHWIDPERGYQRAFDVLRPAGHLAIVTGAYPVKKPSDPFFDDLDKVYADIRGDDPNALPQKPERLDGSLEDRINGSGLFKVVELRAYGWTVEYTGDAYVALLGTYSDHALMPPDKREFLFSKVRELASQLPNGIIRRRHHVNLAVARRQA